MKTVSTAMLAALAGDGLTLATCWQIVRTDSTVMGFTDWTDNITLSGVTYHTLAGYSRSAIDTKADGSVPNLQVTGIMDSGAAVQIQLSDVEAQKYDSAKVYVFMVNPNNLALGMVKLRAGRVGQFQTVEDQYTAELRGLAHLLDQSMLELYTLDCQADLGDSRCKISLVTDSGTVGSVSTPEVAFTTSSLTGGRAANFYNQGTLTWLTGANAGTSSEVGTWNGTTFTLFLATGEPIVTGDTFHVSQGCDKSFSTCISTFNNAVNFRGFPFLPGLDVMIYPDAAQQFPVPG